MMIAPKLRYEDEEGLVVVVEECYALGCPPYSIAVSRDGSKEFPAFVVYCFALVDAQDLAHLLVGIEIQENDAAWKRGPRGPAMPTDHEGRRIDIEPLTPHERFAASRPKGTTFPKEEEGCPHLDVAEVGEHTWCNDCGARLHP